MKLSYVQKKELIEEIYVDALDDYKSNPEEFVRRKIEYDILRQLIFSKGAVPREKSLTKIDRIGKRILPYVDLSEVNFYGIDVTYTNFSNTNADVDPQTVLNKNWRGCNFDGMNMSDKSFSGCDIRGASFIDTDCFIPKDKVVGYDMALFEHIPTGKKIV